MEDRILLAHGSGGKLTHDLIEKEFTSTLGNPMLDKLVALYEKDFKTAPKGKTFQECYDVFTLSPTDEYIKVFDGAIKTMEGLGFEFKI